LPDGAGSQIRRADAACEIHRAAEGGTLLFERRRLGSAVPRSL
jgi:hypothetical protein